MRVPVTVPRRVLTLGQWPLSLKAKRRVRAWGHVPCGHPGAVTGILAIAETPSDGAAWHKCPLVRSSARPLGARRHRLVILCGSRLNWGLAKLQPCAATVSASVVWKLSWSPGFERRCEVGLPRPPTGESAVE